MANNNGKKVKLISNKGLLIKKFNSLYSLRKYINRISRISSSELKSLNDGKIIRIGKIYTCLESTNHRKAFSAYIKKKENGEIYKSIKAGINYKHNLKQSISIAKESIVVLDKCMNIDRIFNGTIVELSKIMDISEGTIKASIHKTKKNLKAYLSGKIIPKGKGFYFVKITGIIQ